MIVTDQPTPNLTHHLQLGISPHSATSEFVQMRTETLVYVCSIGCENLIFQAFHERGDRGLLTPTLSIRNLRPAVDIRPPSIPVCRVSRSDNWATTGHKCLPSKCQKTGRSRRSDHLSSLPSICTKPTLGAIWVRARPGCNGTRV